MVDFKSPSLYTIGKSPVTEIVRFLQTRALKLAPVRI